MLIKEIQKIIPTGMLFIDDIALTEESREEANFKLGFWR